MSKKWIQACVIRAVKTLFQTLIGYLGSAALLSDISWQMAISASLMSALLSVCTSIVAGLPEVSMPVLPDPGKEDDEVKILPHTEGDGDHG